MLLRSHWCHIVSDQVPEPGGYSGFNWLLIVEWMPLWTSGQGIEKKEKKRGGGVKFVVRRVSFSVYSYLENTQIILCPTERTRDGRNRQTNRPKKKRKKNQNKTAAWGAPVRVQNHPEQLSKRGAQVGPQKCLFLQQREGGEQEDVQPAANRGRKESTRQRLPPLRKMREGSPNTPQSARGPTDILPLGTSSPLSHTPSSQKIKNK